MWRLYDFCMAEAHLYRHRVTGLISAIEDAAAAVWADVLEPVQDEPLPCISCGPEESELANLQAAATPTETPDAQVVDPSLAQPITPAEAPAPAPTTEVIA